MKFQSFKAWWIEHHVRDVGVAGSNPATTTRPLNPFTLRISPQFADQRGLFAERAAHVEQVHGGIAWR